MLVIMLFNSFLKYCLFSISESIEFYSFGEFAYIESILQSHSHNEQYQYLIFIICIEISLHIHIIESNQSEYSQ